MKIKEFIEALKEKFPDEVEEMRYEKIIEALTSMKLVPKKEPKKITENYMYVNQWRKPNFLEGKKAEDYILVTESNHNIHLSGDIYNEEFKEGTAYFLPPKNEVFKIEEAVMYLPPKSEMNPSTHPSWIKKLDEGKVIITETNELEKFLEICGKKTRKYKMTRESPDSDFWNIQQESMHSKDKCMNCSNPPKYEVLWAEGMGHAWFCESGFKEWAKEHKGDIDYVKETKDGIAADKFSENTNPNIKDTLF